MDNLYFSPALRVMGISQHMTSLKNLIQKKAILHIPFCESDRCVLQYFRENNSEITDMVRKLKKLEVPNVAYLAFPNDPKAEIKYKKLENKDKRLFNEIKEQKNISVKAEKKKIEYKLKKLKAKLTYRGGIPKKGDKYRDRDICPDCGGVLVYRKLTQDSPFVVTYGLEEFF